MRVKLGSIVALVLLGSVLVAGPPAAAAPAEEHCAARVVAKRSTGELVLSPAVCRSSRTEALQAVGALATTGYAAQATFTLGVHFDGFSYTGSSISIVGDDCLGGYTNLSSTWDNRVSSTMNGCYRIRHYNGSNKSGSSQTILGAGGNLSSLNNLTESIQYSS